MPKGCLYPSMVTSPDGKGVILLGCLYEQNGELIPDDKIYELRPDMNGDLTWNIMQQKMKYARGQTITMLIPDDFVNLDCDP